MLIFASKIAEKSSIIVEKLVKNTVILQQVVR